MKIGIEEPNVALGTPAEEADRMGERGQHHWVAAEKEAHHFDSATLPSSCGQVKSTNTPVNNQ